MIMEKKTYSWKVLVAFVITGIMVGLLVTAQLRSALPPSSYPTDEYQVQADLIKSYSDDQAVLKSKISNLREQIDEKQKQTGQSIQKNNLDILSGLKQEIGLETANGDGVEINLDDGIFAKRSTGQASDPSLVQAADLRDIVNLLFTAQAKAVSINDQRVIASSPISSVGNTILVNNFHVLPPFTIVAIGNADSIIRGLSDLKALPDLQKRAKSQKIQFSYKAKTNLVTPVYNGDLRMKYVQPMSDKNP